jgi:HK97 family phage major capsid protein
MRDNTAGTIRKLRDGSGGTEGSPIWSPSLVAGEPDVLLGHRVFTDPAVASMASNARTIMFGDMSAYYIRQAGDLMVEMDRSANFATDESLVRAKMRVDGALLDDSAIVSLVQNV